MRGVLRHEWIFQYQKSEENQKKTPQISKIKPLIEKCPPYHACCDLPCPATSNNSFSAFAQFHRPKDNDCRKYNYRRLVRFLCPPCITTSKPLSQRHTTISRDKHAWRRRHNRSKLALQCSSQRRDRNGDHSHVSSLRIPAW